MCLFEPLRPHVRVVQRLDAGPVLVLEGVVAEQRLVYPVAKTFQVGSPTRVAKSSWPRPAHSAGLVLDRVAFRPSRRESRLSRPARLLNSAGSTCQVDLPSRPTRVAKSTWQSPSRLAKSTWRDPKSTWRDSPTRLGELRVCFLRASIRSGGRIPSQARRRGSGRNLGLGWLYLRSSGAAQST